MEAAMRTDRTALSCACRAALLGLFVLLAGAPGAAAQDLEALLADLRSPEESVRLAAGRALLPLLEERYAEALPGLVAAAESPDPAVSEGAVALLAMGGGLSPANAELAAAAAPAYAAALTSASPKGRRTAAQALGAILPYPPDTVVPALLAALGDADPSVRRSAARSLGRLAAPTPEVREALLAALATGLPASFRGAAAEALGTLGAGDPAVVEALVAALADADPFVRQEAIGALADLAGRARGALATLETLARDDPDPLIRELAAAAAFTIETANTPPDCATAQAVPDRLWPPRHAFQDVGITGVTDADGDPVTLAVTSVRQDEGVGAAGSGSACPDAEIDGASARLRAERRGGGDGRIYVIGFTAADPSGGVCAGVVRVCVPHDRSGTCVEGPTLVDATRCAE